MKAKYKYSKIRWVVGIDEAGRGPLAGPVAVGVVAMNRKELLGWGRVRDSKQQSEKKREEIFKILKKKKQEEKLNFAVGFGSVKEIDDRGITRAIARAMARTLKAVKAKPLQSKVLLDGSLRAPKEFKNQKTIIKGDEKETIIALASIVAKVLRDRKMKQLAKKYPAYGFDIHKGYGTKKHISKIKKFGITRIHRKTFCKNIKVRP